MNEERKENAVFLENVRMSYDKNEVFRDITLAFPANRIIGLMGENGIGKTTMLKLIAGMLNPCAGTIYIGGKPISRKAREQVSFMLEPIHFYPFMNVKDAIRYHQDFYTDFDPEKAWQLCEQFELAPATNIRKLSKGNAERLCFLLCLSRRVPLYLLDEPIAGFDPKFKHESIKAVLTHLGENCTVIISSHLLRDLESIFDEIVVLKKGGAVTASAEEIRASGRSVEEFYLEDA